MSVAIVVNSCVEYAHTTVPPLLETLRSSGVPAADVFVVIGGAPERDATIGPDEYESTAMYRPYCNIDENGFMWMTDPDGRDALKGYDWVFYTHDTTLVDPGFYECIKDLCRTRGPDTKATKLWGGYSMSIGLYRVPAVWDQAAKIRASLNLDPALNLHMKYANREDSVFGLLEPHVDKLPNDYIVQAEGVTMYGTTVPRRIEYWAIPGIRKAKANWGQGPFQCAL